MLAEAHAVLLRRGYTKATESLVATYRERKVTVDRILVADEEEALRILQRFTDRAFSFGDAMAFAVSERLGIGYGFSFDRHFHQFGRLHIIDSAGSWRW